MCLELPVPLDARLVQGPVLIDPRGFHLLLGLDARGLGLLVARDIAGFGLGFGQNLRLAQLALGGDARPLQVLIGGDLGIFQIVALADLLLPNQPFALDARGFQRLLLGDARPLDLLLRPDFRLFQRAPAVDLETAGLLLAADPGLLGLALPCRLDPGDLGALVGAQGFQGALLVQACVFALLFQHEGLLFRFEILAADGDHGRLLDIVAQLAARLDGLDELGQAFGIEPVRRVEEFEIGLVQIRDRDGFELEAVLGQGNRRTLRDVGNEIPAPLVHLVDGALGGNRTQRADKLAGQQLRQPFILKSAPAEGRRRSGDRLLLLQNADEELGLDIDAHPVAGDDRLFPGAGDGYAHHVEIDRRHLVDDRQDQRPAVDHHLLAAETRTHEGDFLGRAVIQPVEQIDDHHDGDDRHDEPQDDAPDQASRHGPALPILRS